MNIKICFFCESTMTVSKERSTDEWTAWDCTEPACGDTLYATTSTLSEQEAAFGAVDFSYAQEISYRIEDMAIYEAMTRPHYL